ncbi:DUF3306 domain-containing protein [Noviherbaspirillum agri]
MDAENFFSRWSRRKAQARQEQQDQPSTTEEDHATDEPAAQPVQEPPPTMEDVAALTPQSDFRRFLAQGVDPAVRRSAMKKMISDPHFNVIDGLDIYMDDYNKFQPLPDAMLAALNHAQGVLNPQPLFDSTPEKLIEETGDSASSASKAADMEPPVQHEEIEARTGSLTPPAPESPTEDGTQQEQTENTEKPEDGPDHGNEISRM